MASVPYVDATSTGATVVGNYRGDWSPYIPRNLILRYTAPGDLVLDQMDGLPWNAGSRDGVPCCGHQSRCCHGGAKQAGFFLRSGI